VCNKKTNFYPVILAGGRGTRFWPLSRKRRAKQLLALDGKHTMIQQTVSRLLPLASPDRFWVITNDDLRGAIARQLPRLPKRQIIAEPAGRNTAPAIGLAAFILLRIDPKAVIGMFPSDHVIGDEKRYREVLKKGANLASAGENIVVLAPMPSASVSTATAVNPGFFSSWRKANLRSFITQCLHGIDFGRASRRKVTGEESDRSQQKPDASKGYRISRPHFVKHRRQNSR